MPEFSRLGNFGLWLLANFSFDRLRSPFDDRSVESDEETEETEVESILGLDAPLSPPSGPGLPALPLPHKLSES